MSNAKHHSFKFIFHPTDFSQSSGIAFNHALRIALSNGSYLDILHVGASDADGRGWSEFPEVRKTLERWALLEKGSPRQAVSDKLGVKVRKVELGRGNASTAIARFLGKQSADLIVLATEGREGLPRWLKPSVSERLARKSAIATLFVPVRARGFVSPDRGEINLARVLIPVNHRPDPQIAIDGAGDFLRCIQCERATIDALFVGETERMPEVTPPIGLNGSFERLTRSGKPVDEIVNAANESNVDMIVMATEGHQGFLDAFRGNTTEQVLRRAPCPVLAIPAAANAAVI